MTINQTNLPIYKIADIDPMETVELVYREGSYEQRWTDGRYCLVIEGYANVCANTWTCAIRSIADLLDPMTAAHEIIMKDAEHRSVRRVHLFDRKAGRFTLAA